MKSSVLIFDFDGTIADTFHHALAIANRLSAEFNFRTVAPHEVEGLRGMTAREIVRHLKVPRLRIPLIAAKAERELHKEMAAVAPVKGLRDAVLRLKALGFQMGILTSNSAPNVTKFLQTHQLELFDFISASSRIWGKARRLKTLMRRRGLRPDQVLYIGDETRDIEAARKAGVRVVAVAWGYNSRGLLEKYAPDYLVARPEDLLGVCGIT